MTRARRTVTGLGLVIGGALLGLLSLTALPWFRGNFGGLLNFGTKPSDLRQSIAFYKSAPDIYDAISFGVSPQYFQWLGVTVLLVGALAAAATVGLDGRASRAASLVGVAAALAGLVLTAFAIQVIAIDGDRLEGATGIASNPPGWLEFVAHSSFGAWGVVIGYVAIAVGGLLATGGRDAIRTLLDDADPDADPDANPDANPDDDADLGASDEPAGAAVEAVDLEKPRSPSEDW